MPRRPGTEPHNLTTLEDAGEGIALPQAKLLAGLGAALFFSAGVLFFATSSWLVALAFVLAAGVLLGGVVLFDRVRAAPAGEGQAAPD